MTTPARTMNHNQRVYALKRLSDIARALCNEIDAKYPEKEYTLDDLVKGIKDGTIKPCHKKRRETIGPYTDVTDVFDVFELGCDENPKATAEKDKVNRLHQEASDQIMLGDCDTGLKVIAQLESYKI